MTQRRTRFLAAAVALMWTGSALAGEDFSGWRGYTGVSGGVMLNAFKDAGGVGPVLQFHLGVESPIGLSLSATAEGANVWGDDSLSGREGIRYRALGAEARMRFSRDALFTPWLAARLSYSWAEANVPSYPQGGVAGDRSAGPSFALRAGFDRWIGSDWGLSLAGSLQFCDARYEFDYLETECQGPLVGFQLGPTLRF